MTDAPVNLAELVTDWIDWHGAAKALHVSVNRVRTMIREHSLAGAVPTEGAGQRIPALFIQDGEVVKGLPGLLTVFHDGGWTDRDCIEWIFTDQELPGRPIDALRENRGSEVQRRARVEAFS